MKVPYVTFFFLLQKSARGKCFVYAADSIIMTPTSCDPRGLHMGPAAAQNGKRWKPPSPYHLSGILSSWVLYVFVLLTNMDLVINCHCVAVFYIYKFLCPTLVGFCSYIYNFLGQTMIYVYHHV